FTGPIFWCVVRTAPSKRDSAAITQARAHLEKLLQIAEAQLEGNAFLAGAVFTPADIQFGHVLFRYFDIDIERPRWPNIERYYAALAERPAFIEHVMVSYEELRVTD